MVFFRPDDTQPSDPALYDSSPGAWWTYGELDERVERLAAHLAHPAKALAFCFCRNDAPSVAWYLAALEAGHAVALLDAALAEEFKARLVELYAPDFILASVAAADYGSGAFGSNYEGQPAGERNGLWRRRSPSAQPVHADLAVLLSTSGSTGSPKFVRLTRSNVLSNAESICQSLDIRKTDRAIGSLPFHYSYGLSVLNTHLLAGAAFVLTGEALTTPAFWSAVRDTQCTSFAGVPYSYSILHRLKLDQLNVPTLVTMTQAGGKLHNDLIARFHEHMERRGGRFFVMYGQTEATARIAVLPAHCLPRKLGSAGLAIPRGCLAIEVDGHLTTEPDQTGELVYTGPNVMMGYATSREDLALGDVLGGRLNTGDMAYLDRDGFLYVLGRMKRDAKLFGLRLNLDEIEMMLRVHGPTAVLAGGERLLIYCEWGDEAAFHQRRHELSAKLNLTWRAFQFHRVDALPLNANGKIDYRALEKMAG